MGVAADPGSFRAASVSSQPPVVAVDGLVKRYRRGTSNAVDGISFVVQPGEFFALLGPNGAGKTTTISVLTTTLAPTAGQVRIAGHDVVRAPAAVRRRIGIIFQNPSLDHNLTGEENVRLHAILYGLAPYRPRYDLMPVAYRRRVGELAALLHIDRELFQPIRRLSGGQVRKLEIVRSLMHRPQVLFLDEPTRGLDAASRRDLWQYLRGVQRLPGHCGAGMSEVNAVAAIAQRDLMKLLRDRPRLITTLVFPLIFIGVLGGSLQSSLGGTARLNFLSLTFTGVLAQTLFQSSAQGVISLINDRENDFSQEMFVAPISRYTIVFGKILGESLVALPQGLAILLFGALILRPGLIQMIGMLIVTAVVSLFGGAFGILVLANFGGQQTANQVFTFVMLPQYFLAGVFYPIKSLPPGLNLLSFISPMRYAVDLARGLYYAGHADYNRVVLASPLIDLLVMAGLFAGFLILGTALFVRSERNR